MTQLAPVINHKSEPIRRRIVFENDGWCIYRWEDQIHYQWSYQFTMWHKCGLEQDHAVRLRRDTTHMCVRCDVGPPDGLVALYEMLNWNAQGYGG